LLLNKPQVFEWTGKDLARILLVTVIVEGRQLTLVFITGEYGCLQTSHTGESFAVSGIHRLFKSQRKEYNIDSKTHMNQW